MKLRDVLAFVLAAIILTSCDHQPGPVIKSQATTAKSASVPSTNAPANSNAVVSQTPAPVVTPPVYAPDTSHENDPIPDGVFTWNGLMLATNISADADKAVFFIAFTNVSPDKVAILDVRPSCGCTTAELPPLPWIVPAGGNGQFPVSVNLNITGNSGTLIKSVKISTDKGSKDVYLRISFLPVTPPTMSDADRARFVQVSRADRQAIFKGDCAACHVKHGEGKYGKALYDADCAICHEANPRATMVPDLHNLKVPTSPDFWKQWIAHGKPGSLMGAFSTAEGGPLNDMQIGSLVQYLNETFPSKVSSPQ